MRCLREGRGETGHGFRGDGAFFFLPLFVFGPSAAPQGFSSGNRAVPELFRSGSGGSGGRPFVMGPLLVFLLVRSRSGSDASVQRAGPVTCPRSCSRRWFPPFLQASLSPTPSCSAVVPTFAPLTLCAKPGLPSREIVPFPPVSPGPAPRSRDFRQRFVEAAAAHQCPSTGRPAPGSPSSSPAADVQARVARTRFFIAVHPRRH